MTNFEVLLKDLESRLSSVETALNLKKQKETTQVQVPTKTIRDPRAPSQSYQRKEFKKDHDIRARRRAIRESQGINNPSLDSSSLLAFIGIAFVILAGVFFIKISIDSGWLTPLRQVLLSASAGLCFFILPQTFPRAEKEYGALLAGAGTTILHLTWLGAYSYHGILSANTALICATLVGIFSILINFEKGSRAYVLVAMAGTYLSAPIIGYDASDLSTLSMFLIIWNISFSTAALINKRRDILFIASYYATFTVLILSSGANYNQQTQLLTLQLIQFFIFSMMMVSYSVYHKSPLSEDESFAVLPLLLLFYFSTYYLISSINPTLAPWLGMIVGSLVLGIYFIAKRFLQNELKSDSALTTFVAIAFVHSFYFQLLTQSYKPLASLIIGFMVMTAWNKSHMLREKFLWPVIVLLSTLIYGAVLSIVSVKSAELTYFYNMAYGLLALVLVVKSSSVKNLKIVKYSTLLLCFGHLQIMLGLYRLSEQIVWSGALFVTTTWGIYAILVLVLSYRRRDQVLGNSALIILLAVSLKAFFYDVSNTGNLTRVICLLAEGFLLYGCGWVFKKMQRWT